MLIDILILLSPAFLTGFFLVFRNATRHATAATTARSRPAPTIGAMHFREIAQNSLSPQVATQRSRLEPPLAAPGTSPSYTLPANARVEPPITHSAA